MSDDSIDIELDAEPVTAGFDPYSAVRDAVEQQLDRDVPLIAPGVSRRAVKKVRPKAPKQVRVSHVTVNLLRGIGALPRPVPVVAPVAVPF